MRYTRALAATAAALTLTLAGCSSTESPAGGDGDGFNDADVDFATDMIQHHAQALSMVDLTMGRELDPEMVELTEQIRAAQAPEIERMVDWLESWDEPVPETSRDHANAHAEGHGAGDAMDEDMPGMMSAEEMTVLENAPESEFEELWLQMMIEHHQGAVEMAEVEVEEGESAQAVKLAEEIISAQEEEISQMQDMLEG
ncbi:MAG TPA: DUF305 domain-containing protein [Nocardioidaceae bacterium]|nr:DUF305 domain-containing protein [Nocardioidaceae bacterium]